MCCLVREIELVPYFTSNLNDELTESMTLILKGVAEKSGKKVQLRKDPWGIFVRNQI